MRSLLCEHAIVFNFVLESRGGMLVGCPHLSAPFVQ